MTSVYLQEILINSVTEGWHILIPNQTEASTITIVITSQINTASSYFSTNKTVGDNI